MGEQNRESLGSRLGFLLLSAGCAIGLGNVWRFPFITGKYGGAAFVLIYLFFLVVLGLPVMICEFAVGRASRKSMAAVFENIVAFPMDRFGWTRRKSVLVNFVAILLLATPAALGMNVWSAVRFGRHIGSIDALEDFIVSQNLLPLGSLVFLLFCTWKTGWGWDKFIAEADAGEGIKFPRNKLVRFYLRYIAPLIILAVFIAGYFDIFGK
ncbi:MAG: hypothetical protein IJR93_01440 [Treponema sp.]|nr:hypothetical protein [Treponema sp.]MBQ7165596.1 hypothetical protein [Treponema sp.]